MYRERLLLLSFLILTVNSFSQEVDNASHIVNIEGSVSVTNNGFSFIPSFSLGDPARIVDLSIRRKRFSFEPQFRYALEGRPWSFIFIWRYKLIEADRFRFTLGTHLPALNFRTESFEKDNVEQDVIQTRRFFPVLELTPSYMITEDINFSIFYLYGRGMREVETRNTHFISLRANFAHIKISKQFYLNYNHQFFYLRADDSDGFYFASGLTLAKQDFPLSISSLINKNILTDIAGKKFDWNVSLIYSFGRNYAKL